MPAAQLSRRAFLRTSFAATLGGAPALAAPAADFHFVVVNDLHYRDRRCGEWLQRVAAQIRATRPHPAFVVLAGDLADEGTAEQLGAVREIFRPLPIPIRTVVGNHDYTLDGQRGAYEKLYGARLNQRFDLGAYQFLLFDSTQGRSVYRTRIPTETLSWLDRTTPWLARERPLVAITHFPLGRNWLRPLNASAVLERLRPFPLQAGLSGHWHGLTERTVHGAALSTGRCCSWWRNNHDGSELKGYTLCRAADGKISHEFVPVSTAGLAFAAAIS